MFFLLALIAPAQAQQVIQIPLCGGTLPTSINPSAPTIAVNPSGQVCIAGTISTTVPTPTVAIPSPLTITIYPSQVLSGAYVDGSIVTIGTTADSVALSPTANSTVIALLKAILTNVLSPINVTGSFSTSVSSPLGVNIAATTPINVTVGGITSPQNVTVGTSPVAVTIASSPVNVTGNFSTTQTGTNLVQLSGQQLASPSTYGVAPAGSVQGTNAFVTNNVNVTPPTPLNVTVGGIVSPQGITIAGPSPQSVGVANNVSVTPPTPLQITLPASPISVGIAGPTPLNVTVGGIVSPQNVTVGTSPVAVTIASSPVNVTGNFSTTQTGTNLVQLSGQQLASPSTYGISPVGSVQGVNSFVTNQPTVALSGSPVSVGIAGPTPLNVTIATSPVAVTGSFTATQTGNNIVQVGGQLIASASTYGVAPVGSTAGVNAFVTNGNPNGLATMANSQPVVIASDQTPIAITGSISVSPASPQNTNLVQVQGVAVASASTYGVAPVGSVQGVNAFVTSLPASPLGVQLLTGTGVGPPTQATPLNVTIAGTTSPLTTYGVAPVGSVGGINAFVTSLPASPLGVAIAGPTPLAVTLASSPLSVLQSQSPQSVTIATPPLVNLSVPIPANIVAYSATAQFALATSPGTVLVSGTHQLIRVYCALRPPVTLTTAVYLRLYDSTSTQLATGSQRGLLLVAANGAAPATGISAGFTSAPPGEQYSNGIIAIIASTGTGAISGAGTSLTTETTDCTFAYN